MVTIEELEVLKEKERVAGNKERFKDIENQIDIQKQDRVMASHLNYLESVTKDFPVGFYIKELHTSIKEIKEGCGTQRGWINIYLSGSDKNFTPQELRKKVRLAQETQEANAEFNKLKFSDRTKSLCIGKDLDMLIRVMGLNLPTAEEIDDCNRDYTWEVMAEAKKQAIEDGYTDDEAEEKGLEAESEAMKENFNQHMKAVRNTLNYLLNFHGVNFEEKKGKYYLTAEKSWKEIADQVMETINGVGPFYYNSVKSFKEVGPYKTYCEAAMTHIHWMKDYPTVYGNTNYRRIYER